MTAADRDAQLESVLADEALRHQFREYLCHHFCEESLDFWVACQEFERLPSAAAAQSLFDQFVAPSAPQEINVSYGTKERIRKMVEQKSASDAALVRVFALAKREIFALLATDSFARFKAEQPRAVAPRPRMSMKGRFRLSITGDKDKRVRDFLAGSGINLFRTAHNHAEEYPVHMGEQGHLLGQSRVDTGGEAAPPPPPSPPLPAPKSASPLWKGWKGRMSGPEDRNHFGGANHKQHSVSSLSYFSSPKQHTHKVAGGGGNDADADEQRHSRSRKRLLKTELLRGNISQQEYNDLMLRMSAPALAFEEGPSRRSRSALAPVDASFQMTETILTI
jgi:hypothetical protein